MKETNRLTAKQVSETARVFYLGEKPLNLVIWDVWAGQVDKRDIQLCQQVLDEGSELLEEYPAAKSLFKALANWNVEALPDWDEETLLALLEDLYREVTGEEAEDGIL